MNELYNKDEVDLNDIKLEDDNNDDSDTENLDNDSNYSSPEIVSNKAKDLEAQ